MRLVALAELFDRVTRGHFDRLGLCAEWRCWEVGPEAPTIPEALAAAVGPTGWFGRRGANDTERTPGAPTNYQCAQNRLPNNSNWFAVADFIALLRDKNKIPSVV